jgi:hypothetical protein
VLDIGTGSGVLAVLASGFAEHVMGTDVNELAISYARFNAALNGVANVHFVAGSGFDPVQGQKFSRILANPPFFISASNRFIYSDSPLHLDGFTLELLTQASNYLADDGIFQMICEWVQIEGEPWQDRLRRCTTNSGCDLFVLLGPHITPIDYSEKRFQEAGTLYSNGRRESIDERLHYLRQHRVEYIVSGIITLHKRTGVNWFAAVPGDISQKLGTAIEERMHALTFLREHNQNEWLDMRLRFAPDTSVTQTTTYGHHGWEVTNVELRKPDGILDMLKIDVPVLRAVELFDGKNTLADIISKTMELLGLPREEAHSRCLALAKRLLQSGFVHPVESIQTAGEE